MTGAPRTAEAFAELLDAIRDAQQTYLAPDRWRDELEVVEGHRYLLHVVSEATELLLEGDPERPRFSSIVSPARKLQGDNPDSLYQQALIRGDRAYVIRGRKEEQTYISFTIHGPDPAGGLNGPIHADINDDQLEIAADGSFELVLSPEDRPGAVRLQPDSRTVIVRNYYERERSAHNDPFVQVKLDIAPIEDPGPAPPLDDEELAARLDAMRAFLAATTSAMRAFGAVSNVPFAADELNQVGTPWCFRNSEVDAAGAVDIYYSMGTFDLEPGEHLVMEGRLPSSRFTNVMLWNVHMQTLDYRSRTSSLNSVQMETDDGGRYRIVVGAEDPGEPNWLDTGGHRRGTIFWRFLLPDEQPDTPVCRVVAAASAPA